MIELESGRSRASIDPVRGGRLAALAVDGRELIVPPSGPEDASITWGSFLMAPWPGRLENGILRWEGTDYQLRPTHGRHAIHGVVFDRPWDIDDVTPRAARLSCDLLTARWPFGGIVRQRYGLDDTGLTMEAEIEADRRMPAALGWHPWFRRGVDPSLRVLADETLRTRALIPTGERAAVHGPTDLRPGNPLGARRLDHTYLNPCSPAVLAWPDFALRIEFAPPVCALVIHTPPSGICVEPQTAWPNAFGAGSRDRHETGATALGAGETLRASIRLAW